MVTPVEMTQYMKWLGADDQKPKDAYAALFIPSMTRNGQPIDHEHWRDEAVRLMSKMFGGATSLKAYGGWLDIEQGEQVKEEEISIVFSYFAKEDWYKENVVSVMEFLYCMGRETSQGAVGLHVMGTYIEIPGERYET